MQWVTRLINEQGKLYLTMYALSKYRRTKTHFRGFRRVVHLSRLKDDSILLPETWYTSISSLGIRHFYFKLHRNNDVIFLHPLTMGLLSRANIALDQHTFFIFSDRSWVFRDLISGKQR